MSRRRTLALLLLGLLPAGVPVAAQDPPAPSGAADPPAVQLEVAEVVLDARGPDGGPVETLDPADLLVREGGEPRPVLEVAPAPPWRIVVWLDVPLSASGTVPRAARTLAGLARQLGELGTVELVVADSRPLPLAPPTRDPVVLAAALERAALTERGADRLVEIRREARDAILAGRGAAPERVAAALAEEAALVRERLDLLLGWLAEEVAVGAGATEEEADAAARGPHAVLWVSDGFDLAPAAAWAGASPGLARIDRAAVPAAGPHLAGPTAEAAQAIAALGWTVVAVAPRTAADAVDRFTPGIPVDPEGNPLPGAGGTVRLPDPTPEQRAEQILARERPQEPLPAEPLAPLALLAEASGGLLVSAAAELEPALAALGARLVARYPSAAAGTAGEPLPLAVESLAEGLTVRARRWTAAGTPPAVAALRARRLLAGELDAGTVTVQALVAAAGPPAAAIDDGGIGGEIGDEAHAVGETEDGPGAGEEGGTAAGPGEPDAVSGETARSDAATGAAGPAVDAGAGPAPGPAAVEVRVEPPPGGAASPTGVRRLTLAAAAGEGEPVVVHRTVAGAPAAITPLGPRPDDAWTWRGELELPAGADRVAVVVEDPATGTWGGTLAGVAEAAAPGVSAGPYDLAGRVLPGPRPVTLLRPPEPVLRGDVRFEAVVDPRVARVDLRLGDGRPVRVEAPPFAAVFDLGRLPLPRRVEAVAYDAAGRELGRDELVVNAGGRSFRVRLVEPRGHRAVGEVEVAAEVEAPGAARVERLELYWEERLAATLYAPPFRHRLFVPPEDPEGWLRAVAVLADGRRAEDVRYLNGPLAAERLDVRLTELYVVVTGRDGRPVRGLDAADFTLREEGRRQEIAVFGDAAELPLTVGLAIDSSASMFVKLPDVRDAALGFLAGLVPGRDQAFLVDFDDEPRLVAGPTRDLDHVRRAGGRLAPDGRTSLWKAIVFSLVQLQAAPGRKALIVYSDGADQDADFDYGVALDFAREVGVPVYVIVANEEAVRTGGLDFGLPSFGRRLERLTGAVGGRTWIVRRGDDLGAIYRQIEDELTAQYFLGYYPEAAAGNGARAWRRVDVDVAGRGLTARTVAGYQR